MLLTDDTSPHYGNMPPVHPRAAKRIFLADKNSVDGDTATQLLTVGLMAQREAFIDSLEGLAICFEGVEGMEDAFREFMKDKRQ